MPVHDAKSWEILKSYFIISLTVNFGEQLYMGLETKHHNTV